MEHRDIFYPLGICNHAQSMHGLGEADLPSERGPPGGEARQAAPDLQKMVGPFVST
jgi:hypothetical protein